MAPLSPAGLLALAAKKLPDNTNAAITPADLRAVLTALAEALPLAAATLPVPVLELRKPLKTSNQGDNQEDFHPAPQLRLRFVEGPLPAALLALNPEVWLFRYGRGRKKINDPAAELNTLRTAYLATLAKIAAGTALTPTEVAEATSTGHALLTRVPGFVYVPATAPVNAAQWAEAGIVNTAALAAASAYQANGAGGSIRRARWGHPPHENGSRYSGGGFWSGALGSDVGPMPGRDTEFFGPALSETLAVRGYADIPFRPQQWFKPPQEMPDGGLDFTLITAYGKRKASVAGAKAGSKFRFALVVDAPAGTGRGGKLIGPLSADFHVVLKGNKFQYRLISTDRGRNT